MTDAIAQQPGLRSFIIYDRLPEGSIAFQVTDGRSLPHIRPGEHVVVDTSDRDPVHGELFLIQWQSGPRVPHVMETFINPKIRGWCVGVIAPPPMRDGLGRVANDCPGRWCDFGFSDAYLGEAIVGRVIGIYAPATLAVETA